MRSQLLMGALATLVGACSAKSIEVDYSCRTTRDCPLEEVCDVPAQQCVKERLDGLTGSFGCIPRPTGKDGGKQSTWPGADILGSIAGKRYVLPAGASCEVRESGSIVIASRTLDTTVLLGVELGKDIAQAGGQQELGLAAGVAVVDSSAYLIADLGTPDARVLAYATGGSIELESALDLGELTQGFVDLTMVATSHSGIDWGADCSKLGAAACGDSPLAQCLPTAVGKGRYCTAACAAQEDCTSDTICHGGYCRLPCGENSDCGDTLRCRDEDGVNACW